ncbi:hypothetical protein [Ferroplasma sp.]
MSIYRKKGKDDLDETASYEDLEKDIWSEDKNKSGRKSGSVSRK